MSERIIMVGCLLLLSEHGNGFIKCQSNKTIRPDQGYQPWRLCPSLVSAYSCFSLPSNNSKETILSFKPQASWEQYSFISMQVLYTQLLGTWMDFLQLQQP